MSKFDLGLEALHETAHETNDILSYEYLDTVMQFVSEADEAVIISDGIASICTAFENLSAVCDVLKTHGNTPALEALIGGNFREGFSLEAASAAKEGLWAKFVKWLKTLWAKIKAYFAKFLSSAQAMRTKLQERIQEIKNNGNKIKDLTIKVPEPSVMERNNAEIQRIMFGALEKINATLEDSQKIPTDELKEQINEEATSDPFERLVGAAAGETINVTGEKAIGIMEKLVARFNVLEKAKQKMDDVARKLESESFAKHHEASISKGTKVVGAGGKERELSDEERKELNAGIRAENKALDESGLASPEYRAAVMKIHSQFNKYLSKVTKDTIADASYALSAFKADKK